MLIFAANLEEIEEVRGACSYGDEIFVFFRNWIWEFGDGEIFWALAIILLVIVQYDVCPTYIDIFFHLYRAHLREIMLAPRMM
jgi:hypothetical protein